MATLVGQNFNVVSGGAGGADYNLTLTISGISWQAGDVAVIWAGKSGASGGSGITVSGFTRHEFASAIGGSGTRAGAIFTRTMNGTEGSSFTVNSGSGGVSGNDLVGIVAIWRGAIEVNVGSGIVAGSNTANTASPTITVTDDDAMVFSCIFDLFTASETVVAPTNYALVRYEIDQGDDDVFIAMAVRHKPLAGSESPNDWDYNDINGGVGTGGTVTATLALLQTVTDLHAYTVVYPD